MMNPFPTAVELTKRSLFWVCAIVAAADVRVTRWFAPNAWRFFESGLATLVLGGKP